METTAPVMPVRRDLRFDLPAQRVLDWHPHGPHTTSFFNTMSIFFPVGERFFIHSVRHYRDRITDPVLQKEVAGFIGQEAMHGREHEDYNELAAGAGLPVARMEKSVSRLLEFMKKWRRPIDQLAGTIALEHLTAILAEGLLRDPRILEGAEERYKALWVWHALEETEHKAVAFDVYREVTKKHPVLAYFHRCGAFLVSNAIFWFMLTRYFWANLEVQGQQWNWRGWLALLKFQWISPGALTSVIPAWFAYFKPGFHPWDHDNRAALSRIAEIESRYATPAGARAAA